MLKIINDQYVETIYSPLGIIGLITPWNFPLCLPIWKIAPALLMGNVAILKPSPYTPLTALRLGELISNCLPTGVLTILTGDDDLGKLIVKHPRIAKVSFTGSIKAGKDIFKNASSTMKRMTLELGGNDPAIVLPDIDLDSTIPKFFDGAFRNNGQWCIGIKRLYIHKKIYSSFMNAFIKYARNIIIGDGFDPLVSVGPVQNNEQYKRIIKLIEDTKSEGLKIVLGGEVDVNQSGYFLPITVIDNPPDDSRVALEEAFGPILPIFSYTDIDEVILRANNTHYGLGASVWGKDLSLFKNISKRLNAGTIWFNQIGIHSPSIPFGGHKYSGIGVENNLTAYCNETVTMYPKSQGK